MTAQELRPVSPPKDSSAKHYCQAHFEKHQVLKPVKWVFETHNLNGEYEQMSCPRYLFFYYDSRKSILGKLPMQILLFLSNSYNII